MAKLERERISTYIGVVLSYNLNSTANLSLVGRICLEYGVLDPWDLSWLKQYYQQNSIFEKVSLFYNWWFQFQLHAWEYSRVISYFFACLIILKLENHRATFFYLGGWSEVFTTITFTKKPKVLIVNMNSLLSTSKSFDCGKVFKHEQGPVN